MPGPTFAAIDVETANRAAGSICAVGIAIVRDGHLDTAHSWSCRPPEGIDHFEAFNSSIHGITAADVRRAPRFGELWPEIVAAIGDLPWIAHNAAFDIRAIREACSASSLSWPTCSYGCTLVMSRRALDLVSYRLPIVAETLGVDLNAHHQAQADATAAALIAVELARRHNAGTLQALSDALNVTLGDLSPAGWRGCSRVRNNSRTARADSRGGPSALAAEANLDADPDHPLYGQTIVFTGGLSSMNRQEAWTAAARLGAIPAKSVTRKSTRVVIGDGFSGDSLAAFTTAKARKAVELREKGIPVEVLTEAEFVALLSADSNIGAAQVQ